LGNVTFYEIVNINSKLLETIGDKTTGSGSHTMVGFVKGGEL